MPFIETKEEDIEAGLIELMKNTEARYALKKFDREYEKRKELFDEIQKQVSKLHFTAKVKTESDSSQTLTLNEIDLTENSEDIEKAKELLGRDILSYARNHFNVPIWSAAMKKKKHAIYIIKALLLDDAGKIADEIICAK